MLADNNILPEAFQFLNVGWWVIHLIAIPTVFLIGWALGKRRRGTVVTGTATPPRAM